MLDFIKENEMEIFDLLKLASLGVAFLVVASFIKVILSLRRVVPTNMVHIVQSTKASTPYGRGKFCWGG